MEMDEFSQITRIQQIGTLLHGPNSPPTKTVASCSDRSEQKNPWRKVSLFGGGKKQ